MTIVAGNGWLLMEYLHRCTEANYQQTITRVFQRHSVLVYHIKRLIDHQKNPFCNYVSTDENCLSDQRSNETVLWTSWVSGESAFVGSITGSKWPETKTFFWNSSVYSCSEKWRLFHARNCQEIEALVQPCVVLTFTEQLKLSLTRIERGVGCHGAQLSKRTCTITLECLVWDASQVRYWEHP